MMSFKALNSTSDADHYYMEEGDNYYLKTDQNANLFRWWGKGAASLGLTEKVDGKDFVSLLKGDLPNGQSISTGANGRHRPGFDLTFSAPKSVSILALVFNQKKLIDVHREAVTAAISEIEKDLAQVRINGENGYEFEKTNNLVVARFLHDLSRAQDPALHEHIVVMNMTQKSDGEWRALGSNKDELDSEEVKGFFEAIYKNQFYYGAIFRAKYARGLRELGFELERLPEDMNGSQHGMFEIKGFSREFLEYYSKRTNEINKLAEQVNVESAKTSSKYRDYLTLSSRKQKTSPNREQLWEAFKHEMKEKFPENYSRIEKLDEVKTADAALIENDNKAVAREVILETSRHFAETRLQFTHTDLITKALDFTMGKVKFEELNSAVVELKKSNLLMGIGEGKLTTKAIFTYEQGLLEQIKGRAGQGFKVEMNPKHLEAYSANETHKAVIKNVLSSKEPISMINISVNDAPEDFLNALFNLTEQSGQKIKILAPSQQGSRYIGKQVQRRAGNAWQWAVNYFKDPEVAQTLRGYLYKNSPITTGSESNKLGRSKMFEDVLVIDSAHKMGYKELEGLLALSQARQAKLIFLNADDGVKGFVSGNPIDLMRKAKVKEFSISEPVPKSQISTKISEIEDDIGRAESVAKKYVSLDTKARTDTYVLGHSQQQVVRINDAIRHQLKNNGELSHTEKTIKVLTPVYLSEVQKKYATQYVNDMVIKRFEDKSVSEYLVLKHIKVDNLVMLLDAEGNKFHWNPKQEKWAFSLYKKENLDVASGEILTATEKMPALDIELGNQIKLIKSGKGKGYQLVNLSKGNKDHPKQIHEEWLHHTKFKYGYAQTLSNFSRGGRTKREQAIVDIKGFSTNQSILNELKSRVTHEITVFTDDERRLQAQAERLELNPSLTESLVSNKMPELKKFINDQTIESFESNFNAIADLLSEKYQLIDKRNLIQKSLDHVLSKLSEREAAFKHTDLVQEALIYALTESVVTQEKPVTIDEAKLLLDEYLEKKDLYLSEGKTYWVTKEAYATEKEILSLSKAGKGQVKPLLDNNKAYEHLEGLGLTEGQRDAAHCILTTKDRYVIAQGDPGTGKTTMIKSFKETLEAIKPELIKQGFSLQGVAPTHQAVIEMTQVGIPAKTLKAFITEYSKVDESHSTQQEDMVNDLSKTLLILDEYSMTSNADILEFKRIVRQHNGRVAQLGDIKQFESVAAGRPMFIEMMSGTPTVRMTQVVRQKNEDALKVAEAAIAGDVAGIFKATARMDAQQYIKRDEAAMTSLELMTLSNSIHEISVPPQSENIDHINEAKQESLEQLAHACAREYVLRTPEVREQSPVIVQTHKNRRSIEEVIRFELKERGELAAGGVELKRLDRTDVLKADIKACNFTATHIRLGNGYYEILEKDRLNKALMLKGEDGKLKVINTQHDLRRYKDNIEVFNMSEDEVSVNEHITLRKTDVKRGHYANHNFVVKSITGTTLELENPKNGTKISLDTSSLSDTHWDYAYTKTGYSVQGASAAFPIAYLPSSDNKLAHVRSACIAFTRHTQHCMIFTDNREAVIQRFSRENNKVAALEAMGEVSFYKSLSDDDKALFQKIEAFKVAQHQARKAWSEFFQSKQYQDKPFENKKMSTDVMDTQNKLGKESVAEDPFNTDPGIKAKTVNEKKADLARDLLKQYQPKHEVFKHFKLDFEDLKHESGFKKIDDEGVKLVTDYKKLVEQNKDYLKRAKFARTIIENKETLKSPIMGMKLDWKVLYRDAENAHRHWLANEIMEGTKGDLRLAWKYQKVNRECGKVYAQIKELKNQENKENREYREDKNYKGNDRGSNTITISKALQSKSYRHMAKRDALAQRLIKIKNKNLIKFVLPGKQEKMEAQALKHSERVGQAALYKDAQARYHALVQKSIRQGTLENPDQFMESREELKHYLKPLEYKPKLYGQALKQIGLSEQHIFEDKALLKAQSLLTFKLIAESTNNTHQTDKSHASLDNGIKAELSSEDLKRIAGVQRTLKDTQEVKCTLGETYLRNYRGIKGALPESCRFHPGMPFGKRAIPALIFKGECVDKKLGDTVLQAIYLDDTGAKADLSYVDKETGDFNKIPSKLTYGRFLPGAAILFNEGKDDGRIAIAEGPETALSIKEADPDLRVYAVLGTSNLKKVPISNAVKQIIMCADYDGVGAESERLVKAAARFYAEEKGVDVYKIIPKGKDGKEDFNDVLIKEGVEKVKEYLANPQKLAKGIKIESLKEEIKGLMNKINTRQEKKAKLENSQSNQKIADKGKQSNETHKVNEQNKINRVVAKELSNEHSNLNQMNKRLIEQARLSDMKMPKQQPTHIKHIPGKSLGEHQL